MTQPDNTDAILGGQMPPPTSSATLGGIEGLRQRFAIASPDQKRELLPQALKYGEAGIKLLLAAFNDDEPRVVMAAHRLLERAELRTRAAVHELLKTEVRSMKNAIKQGVLLMPGDRVYTVYSDATDCSQKTWKPSNPRSDGDVWYYVASYIVREQAEQVAKELHWLILTSGDYAAFNRKTQLNLEPQSYHSVLDALIYSNRSPAQPMNDWCARYCINLEEVLGYPLEHGWWWNKRAVTPVWAEQNEVISYLYERQSYYILNKFCEFIGIPKFACVQEEIVEKKFYLRLSRICKR